MKRNAQFDLYALSESRPVMMGLAALWIVLFHSYRLDFFQSPLLSGLHLVGILNRLKETGNCGVDIFLFLSGLGLVFSWTRLREKSAHPVREFYRRRISRVLPSVLIVSVLYYGFIGTGSVSDWMGKIFLYGHFSAVLDGGRYWFFALLIVLYLVFPLIRRAERRFGSPAVLLAAALSVAGALLLYFLCPAYFADTEIIWTRIPVFLLGVYAGGLCLRHKKVPAAVPVLCVPLAVLVWFAASAVPAQYIFVRRYVYLLLTPLIVLACAWLCSLRPRAGFFRRAAAAVGACSLEIYLIYENLYLMDPPAFGSPDAAGVIYAVTVFTASLVLSALLKTAVGFLSASYRGEAAGPSRADRPQGERAPETSGTGRRAGAGSETDEEDGNAQ